MNAGQKRDRVLQILGDQLGITPKGTARPACPNCGEPTRTHESAWHGSRRWLRCKGLVVFAGAES